MAILSDIFVISFNFFAERGDNVLRAGPQNASPGKKYELCAEGER